MLVILVWSQVLERVHHLIRITVFIVVVLEITEGHHGGVWHAETETTRNNRAVKFVEDALGEDALFKMFWGVFQDDPGEFFAEIL